jgi:hypothetical protein
MVSKHNSAPSGVNVKAFAARALAGLAIASGAGAGLAVANAGPSEFGHTGGTPATATTAPAPVPTYNSHPVKPAPTGGTYAEGPSVTPPDISEVGHSGGSTTVGDVPVPAAGNGGTAAPEADSITPVGNPTGGTMAPANTVPQGGGTLAP